MKQYRLRLKRLDFISGVDAGAQGPISNVALLKRDGAGEAVVKVTSLNEPLGLVFGWCLATTLDGGKTPHVDLQGDAVTGDDELIKIAAEFMESGASSDVMHDGDIDGRIVFAMPLVPEVNAALGISSDVHGLAIAMKPSPETFKRFVSKELSAFSIAGIGEREPLDLAAKSFAKRAALTTAVLGHSHLISGIDDMQSGCSSSERVMDPTLPLSYDGYSGYHSHNWVRLDDDSIVLGEAAGHTHDVVMTQVSEDEVAEKRAPIAAAKSSPAIEVAKVNNMTIDSKLAAVLKAAGTLTAEHLGYLSTLVDDSDRESFLTKSVSERNAIAKAAASSALDADPVAYTTADGTVIRKSSGDVAVQMAKRADAMAKMLDAQAVEIAKAASETERVTLEKRATAEIPHLGGDITVRAAIIKAIDGIADEAIRKAAHESLKSANVAVVELGKAKGTDFGTPEGIEKSGLAVFNEKLVEFAKTRNQDPRAATSAFLATSEGSALYAAAANPTA